MNVGASALALALLLPLWLGIATLHALGIRWRTEPLAFLGWAWAAGTFGSCAVLWIWLWTDPGHAASPWLPNVVIAGLGAGLLLVSRRVSVGSREPDPSPASAAERWFFAAVVAAVLGVNLVNALRALGLGIVDGDEANLWAQRGKILFEAGGFNQTFRELMAPPIFNTPHKDYPLLSPLLHLWTYVQVGHVTHVANRLPFQLLALGEVVIVAASLRRATRPWVAALLLLVLESRWHSLLKMGGGYADLLVSLGAVLSLDAWLRWQRTGQKAWLGLAALALASLVAAKNEGLHFLVCVLGACLVMLVARRGAWQGRLLPLACLVPPLVVLAAGWWLNRTFAFESVFVRESLVRTLVTQLPVNTGQVLGYYAQKIWLTPDHSSCVFPAQVLLMLLFPVAVWRSALLLPGLALVAALTGFVAIHIATPPGIGVDWHLMTTAPRVVFQLVPATVLWIGAAAGILLGLRAPVQPLG